MADRNVTIKASGGDYTSLSAALAGEADFQVGEDNINFIIDDGHYTDRINLTAGYTTSSSHRLVIKAAIPSGHNITRATGVYFTQTANYQYQYVTLHYVDFYDIAFSATAATQGRGLRHRGTGIIKNCFFYDCVEFGLDIDGAAATYKVFDCVAVNCGVGIYTGSASGSSYTVDNCTVLNSTVYGFQQVDYTTTNIKNCYVGGSGTADYVKGTGGAMNFTTSFSSDGSQSTSVISVANCHFTDSTDGSEDVHIGSDSYLIDAGTDESGDGFSDDILGNTRSATWDVGAVEYVSAGGSNIPAITNYYRNIGVM